MIRRSCHPGRRASSAGSRGCFPGSQKIPRNLSRCPRYQNRRHVDEKVLSLPLLKIPGTLSPGQREFPRGSSPTKCSAACEFRNSGDTILNSVAAIGPRIDCDTLHFVLGPFGDPGLPASPKQGSRPSQLPCHIVVLFDAPERIRPSVAGMKENRVLFVTCFAPLVKLGFQQLLTFFGVAQATLFTPKAHS